MKLLVLSTLFCLLFISFNEKEKNLFVQNKPLLSINPEGQTIERRFITPANYKRVKLADDSFGNYLRKLPLKPINSEVKYFNGNYKPNRDIYDAVVDLPIGKKDLHQCADAIIRLRAEYLWKNQHYDKIHFNFTNGFRADYNNWMRGARIKVDKNKAIWNYAKVPPSNTKHDFWSYLEIVFTYAGTLSLSKELKPVSFQDLQIGDIFIQGGSPGHAIIVVDVAINPETNRKMFLLAQSYMPAQEIQILKNPIDKSISPWYSDDVKLGLETPEWLFFKTDLKRFAENYGEYEGE